MTVNEVTEAHLEAAGFALKLSNKAFQRFRAHVAVAIDVKGMSDIDALLHVRKHWDELEQERKEALRLSERKWTK
jgi:predicted MarR family transcription regulator